MLLRCWRIEEKRKEEKEKQKEEKKEKKEKEEKERMVGVRRFTVLLTDSLLLPPRGSKHSREMLPSEST